MSKTAEDIEKEFLGKNGKPLAVYKGKKQRYAYLIMFIALVIGAILTGEGAETEGQKVLLQLAGAAFLITYLFTVINAASKTKKALHKAQWGLAAVFPFIAIISAWLCPCWYRELPKESEGAYDKASNSILYWLYSMAAMFCYIVFSLMFVSGSVTAWH